MGEFPPPYIGSATLAFVICVGASCTAPPAAKPLELMIGQQRWVTVDMADVPHVEPVVAVNPRDPRQRVVAAMVIPEPHSDAFRASWTVHVLRSTDAGATWQRRLLPGLGGPHAGIAGDPWLAWSDDGTLHLSCLVSTVDETGRQVLRTWLFRSHDGGNAWSDPVPVPFAYGGSVDHPVLRERDGALLVFATGGRSSIVAARARRDEGEFEPLPVFEPDDQNNNLGSGVALDANRFVFSYYSVSVPQPGPLWAIRSADAGRSYQRAMITSEHVAVGFPMMALDRSSAVGNGRAYAVFTRSFEQSHVMLAHSDDGGATWSDPVVVHADTAWAPRLLPNVAVDARGYVAVAWVDGRHHAGPGRERFGAHLQHRNGSDCWDVYATVSRDHGRTFLPELRLTPQTTCSDASGNGSAGRRWRFGGDYLGLTWDAAGGFHPVWADSRTGTYQIWTTRVHLE